MEHQPEIPVGTGFDDMVGIEIEEIDGHRELRKHTVPRIYLCAVTMAEQIDADKHQIADDHQTEKFEEMFLNKSPSKPPRRGGFFCAGRLPSLRVGFIFLYQSVAADEKEDGYAVVAQE